MNLWEILAAVNSTVRKNPDSSIAQLMGKFEEKYLADDGSMSAVHPAEVIIIIIDIIIIVIIIIT